MLGVTLQCTNIPYGLGGEVFATDTWKYENARQVSVTLSEDDYRRDYGDELPV